MLQNANEVECPDHYAEIGIPCARMMEDDTWADGIEAGKDWKESIYRRGEWHCPKRQEYLERLNSAIGDVADDIREDIYG